MIDYRFQRSDKRQASAISPSGGRRRRSAIGARRGLKSSLSASKLVLLLSALLFARSSLLAHTTPNERLERHLEPERPANKLDFWKQLLSALLAEEDGRALAELAHRLNSWPDQKQAALFYLQLLAGRPHLAGSAEGCLRVSLGQLGASLDRFAALELGGGGGGELEADLAARLEELGGGELAKLAVENANLVTRLLLQPERGLLKRIASRQFFKYLLASKLEGQRERRLLHSLGLAFFEGRRQSASFAPLALLAAESGATTQLLDLAQHPVAANPASANNYFRPRGQHALPFLAKWRLASERRQLGQVERRLAGQLESLGRQDEEQEEAAAAAAVAANAEPETNATLNLRPADGSWFSPYMDCGLSNRWLLTYSIPFFASSGEGAVEFR